MVIHRHLVALVAVGALMGCNPFNTDPFDPGTVSFRIEYVNSGAPESQMGRAGEALLRVGTSGIVSEDIVLPPVGTRIHFVIMHRGELIGDKWCEVTHHTGDQVRVSYAKYLQGMFDMSGPRLYCWGFGRPGAPPPRCVPRPPHGSHSCSTSSTEPTVGTRLEVERE